MFTSNTGKDSGIELCSNENGWGSHFNFLIVYPIAVCSLKESDEMLDLKNEMPNKLSAREFYKWKA
jgi:hypothetical protein